MSQMSPISVSSSDEPHGGDMDYEFAQFTLILLFKMFTFVKSQWRTLFVFEVEKVLQILSGADVVGNLDLADRGRGI